MKMDLDIQLQLDYVSRQLGQEHLDLSNFPESWNLPTEAPSLPAKAPALDQQLAAARIEGQEEERARISMELHDGVKQVLAGIHMQMSALREELEGHNLALDQVEMLQESVSMAIEETRAVSHNLSNNALKESGIVEALKLLAEKTELSTPLEVQVKATSPIGITSYAVEASIYRIVQEFIQNTIKYAEADKVNIRLHFEADSIELIISDDGKGFEVDLSNPTFGIGLTNVRKRVEDLGGHFLLSTRPGKGTKYIIELPVNV